MIPTNWHKAAAAISLAPALYYALHIHQQTECGSWPHLSFEDRETWVRLAEASLDALEGLRDFLPHDPASKPEPSLEEIVKSWKRDQLRLVKGKT